MRQKFSLALIFWVQPKRARGHNGQSHILLQDFRALPNLVLNDSSHQAKEIGTKIEKGQKFYS